MYDFVVLFKDNEGVIVVAIQLASDWVEAKNLALRSVVKESKVSPDRWTFVGCYHYNQNEDSQFFVSIC